MTVLLPSLCIRFAMFAYEHDSELYALAHPTTHAPHSNAKLMYEVWDGRVAETFAVLSTCK